MMKENCLITKGKVLVKMNVNVLLIMAALLFSVNSQAQVNKAPNPNFENLDGKIKGLGQIEDVQGWYSPLEMEPADVFVTGAKKEVVAIPLNVRGRAETIEGNNYAGILAYSEREAKPRTYLMAKMAKKLVAGKKYCVKMSISLSDLSKYGCDNVGIYLSPKDVKKKLIEEYSITPQVTYFQNRVVSDQFEWSEMCAEYEADGTERYIAIGNFAPQSAVKNSENETST